MVLQGNIYTKALGGQDFKAGRDIQCVNILHVTIKAMKCSCESSKWV